MSVPSTLPNGDWEAAVAGFLVFCGLPNESASLSKLGRYTDERMRRSKVDLCISRLIPVDVLMCTVMKLLLKRYRWNRRLDWCGEGDDDVCVLSDSTEMAEVNMNWRHSVKSGATAIYC